MVWPSVAELAEELRSGGRSPTEAVEDVLEGLEAVEGDLNAFVTVRSDEVRAEASALAGAPGGGPLRGVPVAVKDNQPVAGTRTTYGSRLLEDHVPDEDHVLVERLRDAGALVVGKTNLSEFGLVAVTDNAVAGPTRNPWDPSRSPGGSSGGSAAAVAAGVVPAATGSDGGGSLRVPAAFCGIVGFKPSYGRVPHHPQVPVFQRLSVPGFLTRSVADQALLLDHVVGPHPGDPDALPAPDGPFQDVVGEGIEGWSVAFSPDLGHAPVDPAVEAAVRASLTGFEDAGAEVVEVDVDVPEEQASLVTKVSSEALAFLEDRFQGWEEMLWPPLQPFVMAARGFSGEEVARANGVRLVLWDALEPVFGEHDVLVTPTTAVPPLPLGEISVDEVDGEMVGPLGWMPFTFPFNFTGQPAASVPADPSDDGLPVGMQIVGAPRDDAAVLQAAGAFERARPWDERRPDVFVDVG